MTSASLDIKHFLRSRHNKFWMKEQIEPAEKIPVSEENMRYINEITNHKNYQLMDPDEPETVVTQKNFSKFLNLLTEAVFPYNTKQHGGLKVCTYCWNIIMRKSKASDAECKIAAGMPQDFRIVELFGRPEESENDRYETFCKITKALIDQEYCPMPLDTQDLSKFEKKTWIPTFPKFGVVRNTKHKCLSFYGTLGEETGRVRSREFEKKKRVTVKPILQFGDLEADETFEPPESQREYKKPSKKRRNKHKFEKNQITVQTVSDYSGDSPLRKTSGKKQKKNSDRSHSKSTIKVEPSKSNTASPMKAKKQKSKKPTKQDHSKLIVKTLKLLGLDNISLVTQNLTIQIDLNEHIFMTNQPKVSLNALKDWIREIHSMGIIIKDPLDSIADNIIQPSSSNEYKNGLKKTKENFTESTEVPFEDMRSSKNKGKSYIKEEVMQDYKHEGQDWGSEEDKNQR